MGALLKRWLRLLCTAVVPVALVAGTVFGTSTIQRRSEQRAFDRIQTSEQVLTAWLARSDALRNYLLSDGAADLRRFEETQTPLQDALGTQQRDARGIPGAPALVAREIGNSARWQRTTGAAITAVQRDGVKPISITANSPRTLTSIAFRAANARYTSLMEARRRSEIASASTLANLVDIACVLLLAIVSFAAVLGAQRREQRRADGRVNDERARTDEERQYADSRRRFSQLLLACDSEEAACVLITSAIEAYVPGAHAAVLRCNNSLDRLEPVTRADGPAPAAMATPRSCLAIRLGRPYHGAGGEPPALRCAVCARQDAHTTCEALVVGAEVIGSVQISHPRQLTEAECRAIDDALAIGTPVLANLRNLALAERKALTDALTGLPNRRAMRDTLTLMLAQAARTDTQLAIILIDLDHFKETNDTFGHGRGDELLTTVAGGLVRTVRASDLIARIGGDEFVALLPATDSDGAIEIAHKLARAVRDARLVGFGCGTTATLGIALFPDHGRDPETLLEYADTALYAAKKSGRDRVFMARGEVLS